MTAIATEEHETSARYVDDLFLHARGCSRQLTRSSHNLFAAARGAEPRYPPDSPLAGEVVDLTTLIIDHENAVGALLARVAPAVIAQLRTVETIAPGYESNLTELEPPAVDELMRPIFETSGIADDFMPWRERFPDDEADDQAELARGPGALRQANRVMRLLDKAHQEEDDS